MTHGGLLSHGQEEAIVQLVKPAYSVWHTATEMTHK